MKNESLSDEELVRAARGGSHAAYRALVERHETSVSAVAYAITGELERCDEIAHETFVIAWEKLSLLRETATFRGWVCGIARRLSRGARRQQRIDHLRGLLPLGDRQEIPAVEESPLQRMIAEEEQRTLSRALKSIPEDYRLPLVLFYQEQQSVTRVAEALEISPDNVKQRLARGRRMLQGKMALLESTLPRIRYRSDLAAAVLAALATRDGAAADGVPRTRRNPRKASSPQVAWYTILAVAIVAAVPLVGHRERPASSGTGTTAAGLRAAAADLGGTHGGAPLLLAPTAGAATDDLATGADRRTSIHAFDFEDGLLPPLLSRGHVVPGPPGSPSRFCVMGTIAVIPGLPLMAAVTVDDHQSTLLVHTGKTVLSFDYWISADYRKHPGTTSWRFPDGTVGPDEFAVDVRDLDQNRNVTTYIRNYVPDSWGHFRLPLSEFIPKSVLREGDRIGGISIYGGSAGGQPFFIDNIRIERDAE